MTKSNEPVKIYEMKITLKGIKPPIWRRIQVRSDITLAKLHDVIQITLGWTDSHLHEFEINGVHYGSHEMDDDFGDEIIDEKSVRLGQVAVSQTRFVYQYDFGDDWEHNIKVEKVVALTDDINIAYCVAGKRACPPEDCGGVCGYMNMLEILAGPECEERSEWNEWLDDEFDPEGFDIQKVNKKLQRLRK